jgi:hypothetical protein
VKFWIAGEYRTKKEIAGNYLENQMSDDIISELNSA